MSFLKDLKARRSVPRTRAATHINSTRRSAADELLRFFLDEDSTIVDTMEFKILRPGDPGFEEALRRARVLDGLIAEADARHNQRKALETQSVLERAEQLLKIHRELNPRLSGPLDTMFDFGPDEKFRSRLPKIMGQIGVV